MDTKSKDINKIEFTGAGWFSSRYCGITGSIDSDEEDPQLEDTTITLTRTKIENKNGKTYITYLLEEKIDQSEDS